MNHNTDSENSEKEVVPGRGLEVVHGRGPEVVHDQWLEVAPGQGLEVAPGYHGLRGGVVDLPPTRRWFRRKRPRLIAIAATVVVVIVIVVLATLLRRRQKAPALTKPSSSPTAKSSAIATLSPIAATAWGLNSSEYMVKVVYQNDVGWLQASTYDSRNNSWSKESNFTTARHGTPLALTRVNINQSNESDIQIELLYQDDKNTLSEWHWDSSTQLSARGSMDGTSYFPSATSELSAYWPFVISQDKQQYLQGYIFDSSGWVPWNITSTMLQAYNGSSLSIVPVGQNVSEMTVFYQSEDGDLMECQGSLDPTKYVLKTTDPNKSLPRPVSMAVFSTNSSSSSEIFTYSLYQDSSSTIQMVWRNSSSDSWNGPKTYDAFKGADNGTNVACIDLNSYESNQYLEGLGNPRCYFQAGGLLKQVQMIGNEWTLLEDVDVG